MAGTQLRYPQSVGEGGQDYVVFTAHKYKSNGSDPGSSNNQIPGGAKEPGSPGGARAGTGQSSFVPYNGGTNGLTFAAPPEGGTVPSVVLYMPTSTPQIGNGNDWQSSGLMFNGPAGAFAKDLGTKLSSAVVGATEGGTNIGSFLKDTGKFLTNQMRNSPGIIAQKGVEAVAGKVGTNANALLATSKGIIFNPNVELLYKAPMFRSFGFTFEFVPANQTEADLMNQIILNFKTWSAPANEGAYFELPYVWQVQYMTAPGKPNPYMNMFKRAALKNVSIQANQQTDLHVSHPGGVPVSTVMSLEFMEVDVITRQDHQRVGGQGF